MKSLLTKAAATAGGEPPISERFLHSEWTNAVDAWQVSSADAYAAVPRLGRKSRMGNKQRDRLWPIFETVQRQIAQRGLLTEAGVFRAVAEHYRERSAKPFDNIVVDEAQDLGVPELRFLADNRTGGARRAVLHRRSWASASSSSHSRGRRWAWTCTADP